MMFWLSTSVPSTSKRTSFKGLSQSDGDASGLALRLVGVAELRRIQVPVAALVAGGHQKAEADNCSDTDDALHVEAPLVARTLFKNPRCCQKTFPENGLRRAAFRCHRSHFMVKPAMRQVLRVKWAKTNR
jgi:hypothetical protein